MTKLTVSIVQTKDNKWAVALQFPDGSGYLCEQRYATAIEASQAFERWAADHPEFELHKGRLQ